jgi:polyribonucleotide nucleotidyltransferase
VHSVESDLVREAILEREERQDGRKLDEFRPVSCETEVLPRTHGSALFTRGQTQALVITTLGTKDDQQIPRSWKARRRSGSCCTTTSRRIPSRDQAHARPWPSRDRHGALAERALEPLLPNEADFPYTIQVSSDITESNGSSSMASVCGGSLSLMSAGVPIKSPCAGVALGLVSNQDLSKFKILTDIQGLEDHFGDMDFKVAGTRKGITAIQMDIKITGLTMEVVEKGLAQAKQGRLFLLDKMEGTIASPKGELSRFAPRIVTIKIPTDRIRDVIGKGGATIRKIQEDCQVEVSVEDDGSVNIASPDGDKIEKAKKMIQGLTAEAEVGKIYVGKVKKITDFAPSSSSCRAPTAWCTSPRLDNRRVERVEEVLKEAMNCW